jgi:type I restriction enzyme S subunit
LGEAVNDLTEARTFQVADEDEIIDPTITSASHTISVGGRSKGFEVKVRKRVRIEPGDLVFSRLHTQNGAFAFSQQSFQATGTFIPLAVNETKIDRQFLFWALDQFVPSLSASDTVGRETFKTDDILALEIPLPPLAEQQRLVARIEELAGQMREAHTLRQQAVDEADALLIAMAHRTDFDADAKNAHGWRRKRLNDVIHLVDDAHKVEPDRSYPNIGIYSFGRGLFHKPPIDGMATSAKTLRRVKAGQFIYSRLFAFEGAYGMVTSEFDGAFVSQEYPTFDCDARFVRAEFLAAYFKPPHVWRVVAEGSQGLGDRRQRVQPEKILSHELWLPPIGWQNQIADVIAEMDALKHLQAETATEIDALLPSILDKAFKGEL